MGESGDELTKWPYVKPAFVASEVQSPINILSSNSYDVSLPSLLYFRYWRKDSVKIKIENSGHARKLISLIFTQILSTNKFKTNEIFTFFFQYIFIA